MNLCQPVLGVWFFETQCMFYDMGAKLPKDFYCVHEALCSKLTAM